MIEPESYHRFTFRPIRFSTFHLVLSQSLSFLSLAIHTGEKPIDIIKK